MKAINRILTFWVAVGLLLMPATTVAATVDPGSEGSVPRSLGKSLEPPGPEDVVWTQWNGAQYALADDGEAIWIGSAMGLVRWEKATGAYRRYAQFEGFPSTNVYAVAVDAAGNRWFGGDGGLSKLDMLGHWSHFTPANSGIAARNVDGVAVNADGTLWLSHGLPDGPVSRLDSDGAWRTYPHRAAAIMADYARVVTTLNRNPLWLVSADAVWMGFWVYDGLTWTDRNPISDTGRFKIGHFAPTMIGPDPQAMDKDSHGNVWALDRGKVLAWNGSTWNDGTAANCSHDLSTLAVAPDDSIWAGIGIDFIFGPASHVRLADIIELEPGVAQCPIYLSCNTQTCQELPASAVLPTQEGVWAVGPGYLVRPQDQMEVLGPTDGVQGVMADSNGVTWVLLDGNQMAIVRDQETAHFDDDSWQIALPQELGFGEIHGTIGPDGDAYYLYSNGDFVFPMTPFARWHRGQWIEYGQDFYTDLFVQDERRAWLTVDLSRWTNNIVVGLDDGGTPTNIHDDIWTEIPLETSVGSVAVDSLGRLWHGHLDGVERRVGNEWRPVVSGERVCDLIPAAEGALLVVWCDQMNSWDPAITVVYANDVQETLRWSELAILRFDLLQTATARNRLWAVSPEGVVWRLYNYDLWAVDGNGVHRYPVAVNSASDIAAGRDGHIWVVIDHTLWRLSPKPDFSLDGLAGAWMIAPGSQSTSRGLVSAVGGYNHPVLLRVNDLPAQIRATFDPNPALPGSRVTMTIEASANVAPGSYAGTLLAASDLISYTQPLTVTVVPHVYPRWLPLISARD
jgi:hypothetical protein